VNALDPLLFGSLARERVGSKTYFDSDSKWFEIVSLILFALSSVIIFSSINYY